MASRRQCVTVLAICTSLLVFSIPFVKYKGPKYPQPLRDLLNAKPVPLDNHFPSDEQRVVHGASNVWENEEHAADSQWPNGQAPHAAADDVFILLKTGAETMWDRVPAHFHTTLKRFPNSAIYSDMGALLDGHVVWDVLQYLPAWLLNSDSLKGYRVRRTSVDDHWGWGPSKLNIEGDGAGWQTDRFKNMPAFLHAWEMTDGKMAWYFMIDGDTYVLTSTFAAAVKDRDPDDVWYLGKGVGANPMFAHGGSGILLSRGAMRAMFHEPHDIEWHKQILEESSESARGVCCGDSVVASEFERLTGVAAGTSLEVHEHGMFQGNSINSLRLHADSWCAPVGTFHHVSATELQQLFDWEALAMARKAAKGDFGPLVYADFYEDFIEPFLVEQRPGWYFEGREDETMAFVYTSETPSDVWDGSSKLDPVGSQDDCYRTCVLNEHCLAWDWRMDTQCRIFTGEVSLGTALNSYSPQWSPSMTEVAAGHMVDRLHAVHINSPCRAANSSTETSSKKPGWYYAMMREKIPDNGLVHELQTRPLWRESATQTNMTVSHHP